MWERIRSDWSEFRRHVRHEWAKLTDEHLDEIDGRRDRLTRRVRDAYGVTDDEAEKQVLAWESSLREPAPRLDSDPSPYPPGRAAEALYNGSNAAAETRSDPGVRDERVVLDNEGPELDAAEHDRPGGAGLPSNQAGGRDGGGAGAGRGSG